MLIDDSHVSITESYVEAKRDAMPTIRDHRAELGVRPTAPSLIELGVVRENRETCGHLLEKNGS